MALSNDELACVYAALILADDKVPVKGDKIAAILKAANYDIEPYWPNLFASALEGVEVGDLIKNIGAAPVAAAGGAAATTAQATGGDDKKGGAKDAPKKEEKKEEKPESDDEEMVSLFDEHIYIRIAFFFFLSRVSTYSVKCQPIENTHNNVRTIHSSLTKFCSILFSHDVRVFLSFTKLK